MAKQSIFSKLRNFVFGIFKLPKTVACWLVYPFKAVVCVAVMGVFLGVVLALVPLVLLIIGGVLLITDRKPFEERDLNGNPPPILVELEARFKS